jgi:hypothetical protein
VVVVDAVNGAISFQRKETGEVSSDSATVGK